MFDGEIVMKRRIARAMLVVSILVVSVLSACKSLSPKESDAQALARLTDYAGEPVDQFTYLGNISGWRALGDDHAVIFSGVNDAYLVSLSPPCTDLPFVSAIGFTSTASTITRGDSVI